MAERNGTFFITVNSAGGVFSPWLLLAPISTQEVILLARTFPGLKLPKEDAGRGQEASVRSPTMAPRMGLLGENLDSQPMVGGETTRTMVLPTQPPDLSRGIPGVHPPASLHTNPSTNLMRRTAKPGEVIPTWGGSKGDSLKAKHKGLAFKSSSSRGSQAHSPDHAKVVNENQSSAQAWSGRSRLTTPAW